jgi:putative membrane protein
MKFLSYALGVGGLLAAIFIVTWFGAGHVLTILASVGARGLILFTLCQAGLFLLLGLAWQALTPEIDLRVLIASRAVRDAATNCLPFSHLGGLAIGVRVAVLHGIGWARAAASSTADVTAEFFGQIIYALLSLAWLAWHVPGAAIAKPVAFSLLAASAVIFIFVFAQRGAGKLFAVLGRHIAGDWGGKIDQGAGAINSEFAAIYSKPGRLALGSLIHLCAWLGSGVASFVAYRALGASIRLPDALAIEGLVDALMIFAFLIPGQLGAQEAAFAAMGAAFGLPPAISIAVSLLRRGRDIGIGVPVLALWQFAELRRLRR